MFGDPCSPCDSCHRGDVACGPKTLPSGSARGRKAPCETEDSIRRSRYRVDQRFGVCNLANRSQQAYLTVPVEEMNSGR